MHSLLASVLLLPVLTGPAPQSKTAEIAKIDALVKSLKPVMKTKRRYFAKLDTEMSDKGPWKEFASDKAREKAWDKYQLSQQADVWSKGGVPVVIDLRYPEEDSGQSLTHFLRSDGSVAKVEAEYGAFNPAPYKVLRSMWFDASGKLLKFSRTYTDLDKKPRPKPNGAGTYEGENPTMKLSRMPFYGLLFKKS